jgi:hypothetical protein
MIFTIIQPEYDFKGKKNRETLPPGGACGTKMHLQLGRVMQRERKRE